MFKILNYFKQLIVKCPRLKFSFYFEPRKTPFKTMTILGNYKDSFDTATKTSDKSMGMQLILLKNIY